MQKRVSGRGAQGQGRHRHELLALLAPLVGQQQKTLLAAGECGWDWAWQNAHRPWWRVMCIYYYCTIIIIIITVSTIIKLLSLLI